MLTACQSNQKFPPIRTAVHVDLQRFSGDWYVIASTPTFIEKNAYAAIENYAPPVDGKVKTTFSFNANSFDGERKRYESTGFVRDDGSNAVWGMQFIWPIKAEYRIVFIDPDYQYTIIGRSKRDYVWIMSRESALAASVYNKLLKILVEEGYDINKLRIVPQKDGPAKDKKKALISFQ
jgi:apolipoprotein D and lipocalin family protein